MADSAYDILINNATTLSNQIDELTKKLFSLQKDTTIALQRSLLAKFPVNEQPLLGDVNASKWMDSTGNVWSGPDAYTAHHQALVATQQNSQDIITTQEQLVDLKKKLDVANNDILNYQRNSPVLAQNNSISNLNKIILISSVGLLLLIIGIGYLYRKSKKS